MTDVGEVRPLDVHRRVLRISQMNFLENLRRCFGMSDSKPVSTPIEWSSCLREGEEAERTVKPYREIIECLTYKTLTSRLDLCAAVSYLNQIQSCPTEQHWVHAKSVTLHKGNVRFGTSVPVKG